MAKLRLRVVVKTRVGFKVRVWVPVNVMMMLMMSLNVPFLSGLLAHNPTVSSQGRGVVCLIHFLVLEGCH